MPNKSSRLSAALAFMIFLALIGGLVLIITAALRGASPSGEATNEPMPPALTDTPSIITEELTQIVVTGHFSASQAALEDYDPEDTQVLSEALRTEIAVWLTAGGDPSALGDALEQLPILGDIGTRVITADFNGDGINEVVIDYFLPGLGALACTRQAEAAYQCVSLTNPDQPTIYQSGYTEIEDLTGDGLPEAMLTYFVEDDIERDLLFYSWSDAATEPRLIFMASLMDDAGAVTWTLGPDETAAGRQQIEFSYPHYFNDGFDDPAWNHPLGYQVWRYDANFERFMREDETVDLSQSADESAVITIKDQARWKFNEAELAYRAGDYNTARALFEDVIWDGIECCHHDPDQPDWDTLANYRLALIASLTDDPDGWEYTYYTEVTSRYDAVSYLFGMLGITALSMEPDEYTKDAVTIFTETYTTLDLAKAIREDSESALGLPHDAAGIVYIGAGLAEFMNKYEGMEEESAILDALIEAGFPAEGVVYVQNGIEITVRDPFAISGGVSAWRWTLILTERGWYVGDNFERWPQIPDMTPDYAPQPNGVK